MSFTVSYRYEITDKMSATLAKIHRLVARVNKELEEVKVHARAAAKALGTVAAASEEVFKKTELLTRSQRKANLQIRAATTAMGNQAKRLHAVERAATNARTQIATNTRINRNYAQSFGRVSVEASAAARSIRDVNHAQRVFHQRTSQANNTARRQVSAFQQARSQAASLRGEVVDTVVSAFILSRPVKSAVDFQSRMVDVKKAINEASPAQFTKLTQEIKNMSLELGVLPGDVAAIVEAGGKVGVPIDKISNFTKEVAKTSVALDLLPDQAATSLAKLSTKMKIPIEDISTVVDALTTLENSTSATARSMLDILGRTSGTFSQLGVPPEMAAGFAAFADQVEVSSELAASGFNLMIRSLQKDAKVSAKLLEDPKNTIMGILEEVSRVPAALRPGVIKNAFGDEAGRFVIKAVSNLDLLADTLALVEDNLEFAGAANQEFKLRMQSTQGQVNQFKAGLNVLSIELGSAFLPALNGALQLLTPVVIAIADFARENPLLTQTLVTAIGALVLFRLVMVSALFLWAQGKIALLGMAAAATFLKLNVVALAIIGPVMATIRAAVLSTALMFGTLGTAVGVATLAIRVLAAATGIGLVVVAVSLIVQYWDEIWSIIQKIGSYIQQTGLFQGISGLISSFTGDDGDVALTKNVNVAADNSVLKQQGPLTVNGQIGISANGGAKVDDASLGFGGLGNLGFNIAGAGGQY